MTIAQIAYIASCHDTLIAMVTHMACVDAARRDGVLGEMEYEYERLCRSARYRASRLGAAYA